MRACFFVFEAWKPAGSNDCIEQLQLMVDVAQSWGCACVPPSPRAMLDHTLQGDDLGDSWSKYVRYTGMVDDAPGPRVDYDWTDLAACLDKANVVRFPGDPHANFWKEGNYRKVLKTQGTRLYPSERIQGAVDRALRQLGTFTALKVRRGDYLSRYGKVCQPLTTAFVAALVPTNDTVLVLTQGDLGLDDVLTERDLPQTNDSIFDYIVALRVAQHAQKYIVVHPKFGLRDAGIRRSIDNIRDASFAWIWCPRHADVPIGFVLDDPASFYRRATATRNGTFPFVGHIGG